MPKRRDPDRPRRPGAGKAPDARPPEQEEVERAIRSVVERLKPKTRKDKPDRKT